MPKKTHTHFHNERNKNNLQQEIKHIITAFQTIRLLVADQQAVIVSLNYEDCVSRLDA